MATTYPTLGKNPTIQGWEEQVSLDPTISSKSEAGYRKTRQRHTRQPKRWHVVYMALSNTDKGTLETHEQERGVGSASFSWTNPVNSTGYTVRFMGPVRYRLAPAWEGGAISWDVEFDLEEV